MTKKIKQNDNEIEIKKQLEELKAQLQKQSKKPKVKKTTKIAKPKAVKIAKPKAAKIAKPKAAKIAKPKAAKIAKEKAAKIAKEKAAKIAKEKAAKIAKEKAKKAAKIAKEKTAKAAKIAKEKAVKAAQLEKEKAEEEAKTPEEELEEQFSDEQIRNFQIEKMDMDRITNKVCEIVAEYEDEGMLQSDLWKKLKLSSRDGSRLALRLERRGLISREKILQKDRWTYKLIIEQTPISLESLQNSPCLTCPVEQKCDIENVHPEPSPLYCQLIEDWVVTEFTKKKK
ncbi:MAG: transcriptional regulator [Candidatus Nitrosopelagicus sp.]|nr:transcriptional regulator [Candidatus Nitrosopelagicus sp.]